jgi:hypothetical protein
MQPSAKIIADSISEHGDRLTTVEARMHRFVLAEANTHKDFSRNSASSRAIPIQKTLARVRNDPALPVWYGKNQKGMQAKEEVSEQTKYDCEQIILLLQDFAITCVEELESHDLHKQISNRYLEPWLDHTVIISSTKWDNFFHQRCHPDAQPEMKAVADEIQRAYYKSTPKLLKTGEFHTPYVTNERDLIPVRQFLRDSETSGFELNAPDTTQSLSLVRSIYNRISVARCARVSYLNQDGEYSIQADVNLFNRLKEGMHWSPFEHVAKPCPHMLQVEAIKVLVSNCRANALMRDHLNDDYSTVIPICSKWGNFHGFDQYRKEFPNEYRRDFQPNLPDVIEYLKGKTA